MDNNSMLITQMRLEYNQFTNVEQTIADYFLNNPPLEMLSLNQIQENLFVSKASLSRFAKRLGFDGFREFIFQYKKDRENFVWADAYSADTMTVYENYIYIINKTLKEIDNDSIQKAVNIIHNSKRILIYGDGMSGFAANEFMVRFKRLGFQVEAFTTDFLMHINATTMSSETLVIGISLSGNTKNTINNLSRASETAAKTLLITSNRNLKNKKLFDVTLYNTSLPLMNTGINISPQLPSLIIIDLLFKHCIMLEPEKRMKIYNDTIRATKYNWLDTP